MSLKQVIATGAAVIAISLSGALGAEPAPVVEGGATVVQAAVAPVVEGDAAAVPAVVADAAAVSAPSAKGKAAVAPPAVDAAAAAAVKAAEDEAAAAQRYKRTKMDEATAADDKFHANRTQANMIARDKAEAEAAAAIKEAQAAEDRVNAARDGAPKAVSPR